MGTLPFTMQEFLILDLSSLHPYDKPCLEHTARRWCTLLGSCSQLIGYSLWWSDHDLDSSVLVRTCSESLKTALRNGYKVLGD